MNFKLENYDKIIWRINGTLLLLACIGAILVCTIVGYKLLREVFEPRHAHDLVNVDQNTMKEEFLSLGSFQALKGTYLILVPLTSEQKYDASYYSKRAYSSARNYLVFNTKTKEGYWIWKDNSSMVLEESKVHDQITDEKYQKVKGLLFALIQKDSNSDGVLDDKDQKSIQYFDLSSQKAFSIAESVDRAIGLRQISSEEILTFYSRGGKSYTKGLNLISHALSDETEIKIP